MKSVFLGIVVFLVMGCDDTTTTTQTQEVAVTGEAADPFASDGGAGGASASSSSSGAPIVNPCGPTTEAVLPAMGLGDVYVFCSECTNTCAALGEPCGSYGAPCSIDGAVGVCVSCCDGPTGELRCKTLP